MKEYDFIVIGTGSAMNFVSAAMEGKPDVKVAIIDRSDPGGICLTVGCIPTKMLVYPADLVRMVQRLDEFGIDVTLNGIDFKKVMKRMKDTIGGDIEAIRQGLSSAPNIDYYPHPARFVSPYTLELGGETIHSEAIFLCTGSKPLIPPVEGLEKVGYLTSDTILDIDILPDQLLIVGGGYVAAEYGHFFSAMGSRVTIIGRNPQFLKMEEPEVSELALRRMREHMEVHTGLEVVKADRTLTGKNRLVARETATGKTVAFTGSEILVASGRSSNSDILDPGAGGVETDNRGWIVVDDQFHTSQEGVWAFGDATGKHLFKHVANAESIAVYYNAFQGGSETVPYHAVPHAVFSHPEIAGVGLREAEAVDRFGEENVLIGFQKYENTAKGGAMGVRDYFVKVILEAPSKRILGAHIIGPEASVLVQGIIDLMNTDDMSSEPVYNAMYIHPALPEVVQRAFGSLMTPGQYRQMRSHAHGGHH